MFRSDLLTAHEPQREGVLDADEIKAMTDFQTCTQQRSSAYYFKD